MSDRGESGAGVSPTVAALFVEGRGPYSGLLDVDCWPIDRDARLYPGPLPVVAHPPCAWWCRLAKFVESRGGAPVGADEGTFAAALAAVRRWGGVLEHPAWSLAWAAHDLVPPPAFGWARTLDGGWVCEVSQAAYGHRAPKATWLYYVGAPPPPALDWSRPACEMTTTTSRRVNGRRVEMQDKSERARTPIPFRDVLLRIARASQGITEPASTTNTTTEANEPQKATNDL